MQLPAGEEMQDARGATSGRDVIVRRQATSSVTTEGGADLANARARAIAASQFEPRRADGDGLSRTAPTPRLRLIVLSPCRLGDGHPGAMTLDEKAQAASR